MSSYSASNFCFRHAYVYGAVSFCFIHDVGFFTFSRQWTFHFTIAIIVSLFFISLVKDFSIVCSNYLVDVICCGVRQLNCVSVERHRKVMVGGEMFIY